jgi:hypothetical protein
MNFTDWLGFLGVFILLIAFLLNLLNVLSKNSILYMLLNIVGAGIACVASILIHYLPFIILEGVWTIVSIGGFLQTIIRKEKL